MTTNERLTQHIVAAMPTCGASPVRAWPLVLFRERIGTLDDRDAWRKFPFVPETGGFGSHLITEIVAHMCSESDAETRFKRCRAAVEAAIKSTPEDYSACMCAIVRAYKSVRWAQYNVEEKHISGILLPFYCAIFIAALLYAQICIDLLADDETKAKNAKTFTCTLPVLADGHIRMMFVEPDFSHEKIGASLLELHQLSTLECVLDIAVNSIDKHTDINADQISDFLQTDRVMLNMAGHSSWVIFALLGSLRHVLHNRETGSMSMLKALDTCDRFISAGYYIAMEIDKLFCSGLPKMRAPLEIRNEAIANKKYLLWQGVTDIDWHEKNLEGLTLYYDKPENLIYATVIGTVDMTSMNDPQIYPDIMSVQFFLDVSPLESDKDWQDIQRDFEETAAENDGDDSLNEYGLVTEAIRMCLVPKEKKIIDGSNRAPDGSVRGIRRPKKNEVAVTYIPRRKYKVIRSTDAESGKTGILNGENIVQHQHASPILHMVAGFPRQLPANEKASNEARQQAKNEGFEYLPDGYTYVRTHTRGQNKPDEIHKMKVKRDAE